MHQSTFKKKIKISLYAAIFLSDTEFHFITGPHCWVRSVSRRMAHCHWQRCSMVSASLCNLNSLFTHNTYNQGSLNLYTSAYVFVCREKKEQRWQGNSLWVLYVSTFKSCSILQLSSPRLKEKKRSKTQTCSYLRVTASVWVTGDMSHAINSCYMSST